jgi:hypothetical protein
VYLNIDGCSVYGENCGDAAYPPLTGELTYVAPVDCVHYLRGAVPTGRCYQVETHLFMFMLWSVRVPERKLQLPLSAGANIILSHSSVALFSKCVHSSRRIILAPALNGSCSFLSGTPISCFRNRKIPRFSGLTLQGGLGVAWGYLSRSDNQAEMPVKHLSSFAGEQQMMMQYMSNATDETLDERRLFPKGAEFALRPQNNIFPAYLGGVWRVWLPLNVLTSC